MAAGCSLAILFSNPRNLRLRRKPDPLTLGLLRQAGGQFLYKNCSNRAVLPTKRKLGAGRGTWEHRLVGVKRKELV